MDFLETARLLMDLREKQPLTWYEFVDGSLVIHMPIDEGVPEDFAQAAKMFEPA